MNFSTTNLRTDRHWRSATGLDQKRFQKLLGLLPAAYEQLYGQSMEQRHKDCPDEPTLSSYEDLLLFTLFSLKSAGRPVPPFFRFAWVDYGDGWFDRQA